ncbi:helix-turn-helix domain-containing protein [Clostridium cylindrosporum]|uniref:DNA-binding protein n=1 Tax=Clostridium cylindrosporum DSM 605 TaxID=1121307 RepID=A0A0J8D4Q3_CLOCY|nr:cupin domain-containing protein [Clostridium cylindrosporum]KMT21145.1 DNA-binding protein [Clostridium cylindrosporum DSM 605]
MDIGKAVRTQRIMKNLSVRDLASITGLSPGAISKIENGKTIPNVLTMKNIATAMDVSVSYFFIDSEEEHIQVFRKKDRRALIRNIGEEGVVHEEMLTRGKDLRMQPDIITFSPGSNSGPPLNHKGEEFIYVLSGKLKCILEDIGDYELEEGDSIYYPSSMLHRWENVLQDEETRMIVVASPASF